MKIYRRTTKFFPTYVKGIARTFNWLKCVGEIMHVKSTAGCQISSFIFGFSGEPYNYPLKNCRGTAKFFPTWVYVKGIARTFNWIKCLGGFLHLKLKQGVKYQLWYLIFFYGGLSLWISHETYIKDGKVLGNLEFKSKVLPGPLTDLSACVGFCTSSPQQGVKYQHWNLIFFYGGGSL